MPVPQPVTISQMPSTQAKVANEMCGLNNTTRPATNASTPSKMVHPRRGMSFTKMPPKKSITPMITQKRPRISASAVTVWKMCRRHRMPTTIDRMPISA